MPAAARRLRAPARREQIVAAATPLFARLGFRGTTTRLVAERAGVNEAILFRHFATKEDLYWAVLEAKRLTAASTWTPPSDAAAADIESALAELAADILRRSTSDATLTRLLFFCALERHRLSDRYFASYGAQRVDDLSHFLRACMRARRLRETDPRAAARAFLGMVVYRFLVHELFGGKRREKLDIPHVSRELAHLWLDGLRPRRRGRAA
ncbi:MAG TPA: helix-turn-helix domain-containing protein [Planctomycetota bacterium]|nr:helix-turn-helix domain-containing protein [Planctomycetota bacterium]